MEAEPHAAADTVPRLPGRGGESEWSCVYRYVQEQNKHIKLRRDDFVID